MGRDGGPTPERAHLPGRRDGVHVSRDGRHRSSRRCVLRRCVMMMRESAESNIHWRVSAPPAFSGELSIRDSIHLSISPRSCYRLTQETGLKQSPGGWTPGFSRLKVSRIRVGEGPRESLALSRTSPDARLFHRAAVPHEVSHDVHDDRHDRGARGSRDRTRARNPPRSLRQI